MTEKDCGPTDTRTIKRRFTTKPMTVGYWGGGGWYTEWAVYDNEKRCNIAERCRSRTAARQIAKALNAIEGGIR